MQKRVLLQIRVLGRVEDLLNLQNFFVKTRFFVRFNRFIMEGVFALKEGDAYALLIDLQEVVKLLFSPL